MAANLRPLHPNPALLSAQRAASWLLAALVGIGGVLALLLVVLLTMFAETLLPHFVEFCLTLWHALSVQVAYRWMFLGLVVLGLAYFAFFVRLWWNARATQRRVQMLLAHQVLAPARLTIILDELGLAAHVDVVEASHPVVFCYGWRAPRILMTTGLVEFLDEPELRGVLAHERYHLEQRDPFKILFARALRDALVFLPLLRDLVENYVVLQEIAADQAALAAGATRDALASALLKLLHSPTLREASVSAYTPLGARVHHLANPERPFTLHFAWQRVMLSAVAFALISLAIFHPMAPMALGEALHADCHLHVVFEAEAVSIIGS